MLEQAIPKVLEILFGYGLPGVIIIFLIWERKILQDQIKDIMKSLNDSQEHRITEARETTQALGTVADIIETLKEFMRDRRNNRGDRQND